MIIMCIIILIVCAFIYYSAWKIKEIPSSISETYYSLGADGWMFQFVMIVVGIVLCPLWINISDEHYQPFAFLACSGLMFVGSAPSFRLPIQGFVHYSAAFVCCSCAVLWQVLEGLWDITLLWCWLGGMASIMWRDKWCFCIEIAVIGSLFSNLLILC